MLVEHLVFNTFQVCQSRNVVSATIATHMLCRFIMSKMPRVLGAKLAFMKCVLNFEPGFVDHVNVRFSILRKKKVETIVNGISWRYGHGHVHIDVGTRLYEHHGFSANAMLYGVSEEERAKMNFLDELDEVTTAQKKRNAVLARLWIESKNEKKFFGMIYKTMAEKDKVATSMLTAMRKMLID
jgi:hypothetical protein